MDVVLLHDEWLLPVDLYQPLQEAGHRVVSHASEPPALGAFLDAMRWKPQVFLVDGRGRTDLAIGTVEWLRATAPWNGLPLLVHPPARDGERARLLAAAEGATVVDGPEAATAALTELAGPR